jgi:predicted metal-dependent HD superfamily phosphohydrolase
LVGPEGRIRPRTGTNARWSGTREGFARLAAVPALITWWTHDVRAVSPRADSRAVEAAGAALLERWAEPHRRYHSTRHLVEMFWAMEDLTDAGEITDRESSVGRVAAWLHDAVYDPAAVVGANESASAELAETLLPGLGLSVPDVSTVVELVRMTADHAVRRDSGLHRAFHDADLWILAAPPERFDEYCHQVREEYAAVPDPLFRAARAEILRNLVGAEGIYLTEHGRTQWDAPARDNVDRELTRLS